MDWKAHIVIGAVFAFAAAYIVEVRAFPELVFFAFFGALSALVPDLDHESSKGRKILDSAMVLIAAVIGYLYVCGGGLCVPGIGKLFDAAAIFLIIAGAYFVFFRFFKPRHRGITHTLAACSVFGVLVYLAAGFLPALAGFAGYLSHLVADRQIKLI
jgi:membrane-bound metal-dependent hydrolase YbcI (DUF457 family)